MMRNDAPIILTREQHVEELIDFWRQQRLDRVSDDIIFEEDERVVATAMYEPTVMKLPPIRAWLLSGLFWGPVVVLAFEFLRP